MMSVGVLHKNCWPLLPVTSSCLNSKQFTSPFYLPRPRHPCFWTVFILDNYRKQFALLSGSNCWRTDTVKWSEWEERILCPALRMSRQCNAGVSDVRTFRHSDCRRGTNTQLKIGIYRVSFQFNRIWKHKNYRYLWIIFNGNPFVF